MASYTGLSEKNINTHRSGFDISQKNAFTAKVGELLPVYWDISMPNDSYRISTQYFTRTQPIDTSAYTRIREYFDWYAVPLRLLWKSAPTVITQMQEKESVQALSMKQNLQLGTYFPALRLQDLSNVLLGINGTLNPAEHASKNKTHYENYFGFSRANLTAKLLKYLGYGNFVVNPGSTGAEWPKFGSTVPNNIAGISSDWFKQDVIVNIFPILAYQKIYQDFFRWSQWENANPSTWNVDYFTGESPYMTIPPTSDAYWNSKGMFDLQYCNWNKDLFMGVLPNSQYGDVSIIDISGGDSKYLSPVVLNYPSADSAGNTVYNIRAATSFSGEVANISPNPNAITTSPFGLVNLSSSNISLPGGSTPLYFGVSLQNISRKFSVLALRQAEALQHWKEVIQSTDTDYRSQMEAQFGVKLPAALSNVATYIGGIARNLDISEVLNQNLSQSDSTAYIKGKGVGTGQDGFTYQSKEPSVIMCIYHAIPLLDYDLTGPDPQLLITDAESYPQPAFDNIGMQSLPSVLLNNTASRMNPASNDDGDSSLSDLYMGYVPRYYHHKTKVDVVRGAFTTTLRSWVAPVNAYMYWDNLVDTRVPLPSTFNLDYRFFKVNPSILNPIFGVSASSTWDTDQLLVNCYNQVYVARNLSRDGLPY